MGNCDFAKNNQEIPGTINKNTFQQQYVIGRGGYGKVWKVKNKRDNKNYAMKEMSKAVILAKKSVTSINLERELLCRLNHPFICNICYAFQDTENLYLILELSNGGDLRYHLFRGEKFNEQQTKYLHSLAIIHRDIKPENILFDTNGFLKLTDFGIARTWLPNNSNETSGTPGYMAPEVVNAKPHGFSADFWALGVIIYELMFGRRPYSGIHRKEYKEQIATFNVQIKEEEIPKDWSKESADICNNLLQRKEELRLGSKGIEKIKNHPWFKDINWNDLLNKKINPPFVPVCTEDYFDESYLQSFDISDKLKEDIEYQSKNIRNPNMQKLFKNFYFDKDKLTKNNEKVSNEKKNNNSKNENTNKTSPTSSSSKN